MNRAPSSLKPLFIAERWGYRGLVEASATLTVLSAACLWGGAVVYVASRPTRINPVPWVVWSVASVVAAVNTWAEEGLSGQAIVYAVTGACFAAVVIRRRRVLGWEGLPRWQRLALPLLVLSPIVTLGASPVVGMSFQVVFSWVTAASFVQTAASGYSRDPVSAWWVELAGCLLLLAANRMETWSWLLPLNSAAVSAACLAAIYFGRRTPASSPLAPALSKNPAPSPSASPPEDH
jgi:hypothetical protein